MNRRGRKERGRRFRFREKIRALGGKRGRRTISFFWMRERSVEKGQKKDSSLILSSSRERDLTGRKVPLHASEPACLQDPQGEEKMPGGKGTSLRLSSCKVEWTGSVSRKASIAWRYQGGGGQSSTFSRGGRGILRESSLYAVEAERAHREKRRRKGKKVSEKAPSIIFTQKRGGRKREKKRRRL